MIKKLLSTFRGREQHKPLIELILLEKKIKHIKSLENIEGAMLIRK
jgi:hypothetical protein